MIKKFYNMLIEFLHFIVIILYLDMFVIKSFDQVMI